MILLTALPIIQSLIKLLRSSAQKLSIRPLISLNTNMSSIQLLKRFLKNKLVTVLIAQKKPMQKHRF